MNENLEPITVALVGNPNCGKTALSNKLTGSRDSVANYPRVTVSAQVREITHRGRAIHLVDLPGIYSLTSQSPEERITREFIQGDQPDVVVNVLEAASLTRSLFLTTQLIEMGRRRVYVLNMIDESRRKGVQIDTKAMSSMLDGPVLETSGTTGEGRDALLDAIIEQADDQAAAHPLVIPYDTHLEEAIGRVQALIAELHPGGFSTEQSRWLAINLLEGDDEILEQEGEHDHLMEMVRRESYDLSRAHGESREAMFADARYGFIHGMMSEVMSHAEDPSKRLDFTRRLDKVILHRTLGFPIFIGLMWLMFETTFTVGAYPMDWIDAGVDWLSGVVSGVMPVGLIHDLLVEGIIAGVGGTIIFLPNIVILFFFLALFSESGYLARTAFLVDRVMHTFGLHGKAFIPLIMGFGCNVPAIMACRTIESPRSRLISILISPFMACAARLPVIILFAGAFFAEYAGTVMFAMYMGSIVISMLAAVILGKFVIHGEDEAFVMELPPYRIPTAKGVFHHMWEKAAGFLKKVTSVILVGSIVIWFLQAFPQDAPLSTDYDARIATLAAQAPTVERANAITILEHQRAQEEMEESYLGRIGIAVTPVFEPLGFGWKDTVAILTGLVAKEVVVASYAVLYSQGEAATEEDVGLRDTLSSAMSPLVALAFMVFILLYAPCLATIAVIRSETGGWRWPTFSVAFSLSVAWVLSFSVILVGGALP